MKANKLNNNNDLTLEAWEKELEEEDKKKNFRNWFNKKFANGLLGIRTYNSYHLLTHPWLILFSWGEEFHWAWQRVFRGWDDRARWQFDMYIAKLISEIIPHYKTSIGIPDFLFAPYPHDENYNYSIEDQEDAKRRWHQILNDISEGFACYYSQITDLDGTKESIKFEKAFDLFRKHFTNFWD